MDKRKKLSLICFGITAGIFLVIALWGASSLIVGNEMGYSITAFYFIMPITSLAVGIFLGNGDGFLMWLYPFVFGACGLLIPCLVFGFATLSSFALFFSFVPALIGVALGALVRKSLSKDRQAS
ncbi:MAG: hypothetical protein FWG23_03950 [Eggerthellaceae bacterium]|jgi:hypothetical protein|nr:hypothetical protein [Eggerthellaceae bacterium]MDR2715888.1 hypothetical protein [Coriobacteriaceae bacterium]